MVRFTIPLCLALGSMVRSLFTVPPCLAIGSIVRFTDPPCVARSHQSSRCQTMSGGQVEWVAYFSNFVTGKVELSLSCDRRPSFRLCSTCSLSMHSQSLSIHHHNHHHRHHHHILPSGCAALALSCDAPFVFTGFIAIALSPEGCAALPLLATFFTCDLPSFRLCSTCSLLRRSFCFHRLHSNCTSTATVP